MKKITTLLVLAMICSATLMSCKKDYICTCTATVNVPTWGPLTTTEVTSLPKSTKKGAEKNCKAAEDALKAEVGSDGTASCTPSY